MKNGSIKKWIFCILLIIVVISIASCLGIKSQVKQHSGLNTDVVNSSEFKTLTGQLAIRNVSVLLSDSQCMQDSLTVLIDQDKIIYVGKNIKIPKNYHIIDGTGQFLIPGLVDTHTHTTLYRKWCYAYCEYEFLGSIISYMEKRSRKWYS